MIGLLRLWRGIWDVECPNETDPVADVIEPLGVGSHHIPPAALKDAALPADQESVADVIPAF